MDASLVQKWLEQGERIEARHLDVLKKNQANEGITDGSGHFRQLYYHFYELNDNQINEAVKVISSFQRGKASGDAGKEVIKDFLGNCLTLLSTNQSRNELKQYLSKNGLLPVDNSEDLRRHEEERRREQERLRRQQEEEHRRRQEEEQQRQRQDEQRSREEDRRRRAEEQQRNAEKFEFDIDRFTADREQYVTNQLKKKKFNIPWMSVLKVIGVLLLILLLFKGIGYIKSCSSSGSDPATSELLEDDQDYGSPDDGLYGSLPEGTSNFVGDMNGYPIEFAITKNSSKGTLEGKYKNVKYKTTMQLTGESLPAQAGDITFFGKLNGRDWSFNLTGDVNHISGTALGDNKEFKINLNNKKSQSAQAVVQEPVDEPTATGGVIKIVSFKASDPAKKCKLTKVETNAEYTKLYGVITNMTTGYSVWWRRTAYIKVNGGEPLTIIAAKGMPLEPDKYTFTSSGGKLDFILTFPPLPQGTKKFDFIESEDYDGWQFHDVTLESEI